MLSYDMQSNGCIQLQLHMFNVKQYFDEAASCTRTATSHDCSLLDIEADARLSPLHD